MGWLGSVLGHVKNLGGKALDAVKHIGTKVADLADGAQPFLNKVGLGGVASAVSAGARGVSTIAGNIKSATDRLPPIHQLIGAPDPSVN